jgi:hypothetical protein
VQHLNGRHKTAQHSGRPKVSRNVFKLSYGEIKTALLGKPGLPKCSRQLSLIQPRNSHAAAHMQLPHAPDVSVRHRYIGPGRRYALALGPRHGLQLLNNSSRSHPALSRAQLPVPALVPMTSQDSRSNSGGMFGWLGHRWSWLSSSALRSSSRPDASTAAASSSSAQQTAAARPPPTHLIVMVNGLFGSAANWDVMCEQLQQQLPPDALLHPSKVNARWARAQYLHLKQGAAESVTAAVAAVTAAAADKQAMTGKLVASTPAICGCSASHAASCSAQPHSDSHTSEPLLPDIHCLLRVC